MAKMPKVRAQALQDHIADHPPTTDIMHADLPTPADKVLVAVEYAKGKPPRATAQVTKEKRKR
jgi:hypothetical protein